MMVAAKRPLYEGAQISQLDAISQALANKVQYGNTRASYKAGLGSTGNLLPEGHCMPKTMHETKKILKALNMDNEKIDCRPNGCLLF
jgi:hypothetical protein